MTFLGQGAINVIKLATQPPAAEQKKTHLESAFKATKGPSKFILDSGASCHVVNDASILKDFMDIRDYVRGVPENALATGEGLYQGVHYLPLKMKVFN
jgi:hypothetical protein